MTYGFKSLNSSSSVQLDTDFKTLTLAAHSQHTADSSTYYDTEEYDVSYTGDKPVLVVRSNDTSVCVLGATKSGNTYTWRIFRSPNGLHKEWYIFDTPPIAGPGSGYGLKLFNNGYEQIFNNLAQPMRIVSAKTTSDYRSSPLSQFSGVSGRKYAVACGKLAAYVDNEYDYAEVGYYMQTYYAMVWSTGTNVTFGESVVFMSSGFPGDPPADIPLTSASILVIDVTDY